ncbi:hypothetical protein N0V92_000593 [Colletotrichum tropicale]|nr:hypothetical protein N0V92_000593 [Colletotrichum tropicale]
MGQSFRGFFVGDTALEEFNREVNQLSLFYVYLAIIEFASIYGATVGLSIAGERIAQRIRERYLAAILRQNIAYFDGLEVGEVNSRLTADISLIQDAITGKASATLSAIATFVSALIISFVKSWILTIVLFPAQVLIVGTMSVGAKYMIKYTVQSLGAYAPAASIAEEAISSVQAVTAYGMQEALVRRYEEHAEKARKAGSKSGIALACMIAAMNGIIFWSYGLAFWQGSRFLVQGRVSLSAILTILFANITGAFALGSSGCGKSTIVGLLERFYQPVSGNIYLDGVDISSIDVSWLRQQIGLVGQDPTLFSTTIFENIRFGLLGSVHETIDEQLVKEMVENAAKIADAHDFIMALPDGFSTNVGDSGSLLSGGQRQRIAIARAIIGDPKILILDEATSALDAVAERYVQQALQTASQGRTTIAIAHRLSTIFNADNIIVMCKGRIIEEGTHAELMELRATYFDMVQQQSVRDNTAKQISDGISVQSGPDETTGSGKLLLELDAKYPQPTTTMPQDPQGPSSTWNSALFVHNLHRKGRLQVNLGLVFSLIAGASHPV